MKEFLTFVNNIIYQGAHTQKKTHWLLVVTFFFFFTKYVILKIEQNKIKDRRGGIFWEVTKTKSSDLAGFIERKSEVFNLLHLHENSLVISYYQHGQKEHQ